MLEIRDASSSRDTHETASGGQRRTGEDEFNTVEILAGMGPEQRKRDGVEHRLETRHW